MRHAPDNAVVGQAPTFAAPAPALLTICPYVHSPGFSMQTLTVDLGDRSYPIHIGAGLLDQAELFSPHLARKRVAIVTNTTVAPLYLAQLRARWSRRRDGWRRSCCRMASSTRTGRR